MNEPGTRDTIVEPGEGLGPVLRLGRLLFEIIDELIARDLKLQINYSNNAAEYIARPIQVELVDYGTRLTFARQVLELIEVTLSHELLPQPLRLVYHGLAVCEAASDSDLELLELLLVGHPGRTVRAGLRDVYNKIFGPTYPGELVDHGRFYILSYPGIAFKFAVAHVLGKNARANKVDSQQLLQQLLNCSDDIPCEGVALFDKAGAWNRLAHIPGTHARCDADLDAGRVLVRLSDGRDAVLDIGVTTQQEVNRMLGPPDDYFNKLDLRMLIHGGRAGAAPEAQGVAKFHNYFRYGIDVLYRCHPQGATTVAKVVLHNGGIAELLAFGRWNGCDWRLVSAQCPAPVELTMVFDDLPAVIRDKPPVLLDRNEAEFVDSQLDIVEFIPKQTMFDADTSLPAEEKIKTWGQLRLYGFHRCVLEVVDANGCILLATIF